VVGFALLTVLRSIRTMTNGLSVRVVAKLVDGGAQDWTFGADFLAKLKRLEASRTTGKALIEALLGDDWAAPPSIVTISWVGADGRREKRVIEYD
jgi:hypothetical protein